jgi:hypothetical protein
MAHMRRSALSRRQIVDLAFCMFDTVATSGIGIKKSGKDIFPGAYRGAAFRYFISTIPSAAASTAQFRQNYVAFVFDTLIVHGGFVIKKYEDKISRALCMAYAAALTESQAV